MSGGGGGVIIINALINSNQFTKDDCLKLMLIQDRSQVKCSWLDALQVARIVVKRLRQP